MMFLLFSKGSHPISEQDLLQMRHTGRLGGGIDRGKGNQQFVVIPSSQPPLFFHCCFYVAIMIAVEIRRHCERGEEERGTAYETNGSNRL